MISHTRINVRLLPAALLLGVSAVACRSAPAEEAAAAGAARVESVKGSETSRVTVTKVAARNIDIQTASVTSVGGTSQIPFSALLYDPDGKAWTFVNEEGLTYMRQPLAVNHIDGGVVYLDEGPDVGSEVVTVGAPELYGAEQGVGDDE